MGVETFVFDTASSVVSGEGNIDLRDERVDVVVLPTPKDFSPLSLRSYIRVTGPLKNVSVFPDPIKTGTDSLLKKIFNVPTMIVSSPLQPRDVGQGKDVECNALIDNIQKSDPQGLVLKRSPQSRPRGKVTSQSELSQDTNARG